MDIVGCKVIHKSARNSHGFGTIHEVTDRMVAVCFSNKTGETKTIKFVFPDAFKNGHLAAADAHSERAIQEAIHELKCSVCALENVRTEIIDGKSFCEKCKVLFTDTCANCGDIHERKAMIAARGEGRYQRRTFCKTCGDLKSFTCNHCNNRFVNELRSPFSDENVELCKDCFDEVKGVCTFCGKVFNADEGNYFYIDEDMIYVCPECLDKQTFICKDCGERRLNASLVDSKYVPADRQICDKCVCTCSICEGAIDEDNRHSAFGREYCPECWEVHRKDCMRCRAEFVPSGIDTLYCPDCVDMKQYVTRLKSVNFADQTYKSMGYYDLENVNRCSLFTKLYVCCQIFAGLQMHLSDPENPFQLIIMDLVPYKVCITYLQPEIIGNVKHSLNITMTNFRKRTGRYKVENAIRSWLDGGSTYIETSAGKMKVLDYPVLLRVQTAYDKIYGKEWNGPYDYIEIGNYGDTTNFYIIGVFNET